MTAEQYRLAFRERLLVSRTAQQRLVERPGLVALTGTSAEALDGRFLVTDDRPVGALRELLPTVHARVANVFDAASACRDLVAATGQYRPQRCTAMFSADLAAVPEVRLAEGLEIRPVTPFDDAFDDAFDAAVDGADTVRLVHAASMALRSDPQMSPAALDDFLAYLRSIPGARFLAAVDADGLVRATAAASVYGTLAGVFFVNTDPGWRGRGVGTAMTAAALREAAAAGARGAFLDASDQGRSIYLRLGFDAVAETTLFIRDG